MLGPFINDVTTTPENPPQFRALEREHFNLRRDMKYPPAFADLQKRGYPELQPLHSDLPAAQVFELVQAMALEMSRWEIAAVESTRLQLEAIAGTRFLLKEDVVIQVRAESAGCSIHMRCKSRVGWGVLGMQAHRIARFMRKLKAKLA
jgi:uncharacterized protein (DUF1499 family)